jgi:predicted dehydrogenase
VGSQQRSDEKFRFACELVRNKRIGRLKEIKVGFGQDPAGDIQKVMNIPDHLNYDLWLGPAPRKPYTEKRVHPREGFDRPGWLRISDYCLGMITGWGSHHMDIAHWGMGEEYGGPLSIEGRADFPEDGLWDVHGAFKLTYEYRNGVRLSCADNMHNDQGVRFIGTDGWVYVRRGFIDAYPKQLLQEPFHPHDIRLPKSSHHKKNFIESVKSRRKPVAPAEIGHRSASACILGYISMRLGRKLSWSCKDERFMEDEEANRLLSRPLRSPWRL